MMRMLVLRCEGCDARVGTVTDLRFGLLPSASLCPRCSTRAASIPMWD